MNKTNKTTPHLLTRQDLSPDAFDIEVSYILYNISFPYCWEVENFPIGANWKLSRGGVSKTLPTFGTEYFPAGGGGVLDWWSRTMGNVSVGSGHIVTPVSMDR